MPRSIATKISLAALSLTMTVVLTLGAASYLFSRHTLQGQIKEKLSFEAALLSHRLEARLNDINADLRSMSMNLIVVNALVDSEGRDMYVEPFLDGYQPPNQIPCLLTLCDFAGNPIISCQGPEQLQPYTDAALLSHVIDRQQSLARFKKTGQETTLLIAYPVFYGATGKAEGLLAMEIPLAAVLASCLPALPDDSGTFFTLAARTEEVWTTLADRGAPTLRTTTPLKAHAPLDQLALTLTVGENASKAYAPLNTMTTIYLVIGCGVLFLSFVISRAMGRKLTAPLLALTTTANRVAQNGNPEHPITTTSNDEITQLASSFNTMLSRLQESHDFLEQRVAERTNELTAVNAQLQHEVRERTEAEKKTREYAGTQQVLLQEVNHRVKNNLVALISMLHQEEDRAIEQGMTDYHTRIQEITWRVTGLLTVHRLLSSSAWKPLPLKILCESVIRETLKGLPPSQSIVIQVTPTEARVDSDQAHYLAMILNELATNTMKYALADRDSAAIAVSLAQHDDTIRLTYQDDGPGFPEPILNGIFSPSGIGFPLLFGLVTRSMQGTITLANDHGAVATITFPAMAPEPAP